MPESNSLDSTTTPTMSNGKGAGKGKGSKYPDHPLAWLTLYSNRLQRVRNDILKLVQSPQGIEQLKNWTPPSEHEEEDGSMSKQMQYVLKAMRSSSEMETEIFEYVKMKSRIGSSFWGTPAKTRKKKQPKA